MKIIYDSGFWYKDSDEKSRVFEIFPDIYGDKRGSFSEVLKYQDGWNDKDGYPIWLSKIDWIRQINRSKSSSGVIRGCHAQRGPLCQGKMVEAINRKIYDIITDARPDSSTFGTSKAFLLDNKTQNKLWVPRGFLHGFAVPYEDDCDSVEAIFNYYVDNSYSKIHEICVNPKTVIPNVVETIKRMDIPDMYPLVKMFENYDTLVYSDKDVNGTDYLEFMGKVSEEYDKTGKLWYI